MSGYVEKTANQTYGQQNNSYAVTSAPPPPTLFSGFAGQLEARVAHIAGLIDRAARVADRLAGSIPEETTPGNKIRGNGGCVASQIQNSLEDLDGVTHHAERTLERLERL